MAYSPTVWLEKQSQVGPTLLNKLEQGVQAAAVVGDAAQKRPTFSATPPVSPADGDMWILPAGSNGENWVFRYNAGSASVYKWELVGGVPVRREVLADETTATTNQYVNVATDGPSFTVPRSGEYGISFGSSGYHSVAAAVATVGVAIGDGPYAGTSMGEWLWATANAGITLSGKTTLAIAAGSAVKLRYYNYIAGTLHVRARWIEVLPIRVS